MQYSILKYGQLMLTKIKDLEHAKKKAMDFANPVGSDFIEILDSTNETVTIGYFDGRRFHWTRDKVQTEAWKSCSFTIKPPIWCGKYSQK